MLFKRILKAWKLSKIPAIEDADYVYAVKDEKIVLIQAEELGDGKAEFLGDGTQEEFLESEKERKGLKGIFGL